MAGRLGAVLSTPPFRADHVGSLLRPAEVLAARARRDSGELSAEGLREVEDRAIGDAVRRQEAIGLELATDGELRRGEWFADFVGRLDGFVPSGRVSSTPVYGEGGVEVDRWEAEGRRLAGRLGLAETIFAEDLRFLADSVTTATPKLTIPSPGMLSNVIRDEDGVYGSRDELVADVVEAYREELRRLGDAGCRYLQLDDTSLAMVNDPARRARAGQMAGTSRPHEAAVEVINKVLAGRPADMTVVVHMCRGNFRSGWFASGGYDFAAEAVFGGLEVDGFFLEYDDERSGSFEPLRFVPAGKRVVLGLVTTKRPELEDPEELKRRVEAAARHVPFDQLCLSPQCGFASTMDGNRLTEQDQWNKLRLVVEVAADLWG